MKRYFGIAKEINIATNSITFLTGRVGLKIIFWDRDTKSMRLFYYSKKEFIQFKDESNLISFKWFIGLIIY